MTTKKDWWAARAARAAAPCTLSRRRALEERHDALVEARDCEGSGVTGSRVPAEVDVLRVDSLGAGPPGGVEEQGDEQQQAWQQVLRGNRKAAATQQGKARGKAKAKGKKK